MKRKRNGGYSLVETVVAIAILAIIVTSVSTGMVLAFKMNAKTEQLMQAELAVSSAVETLMAEGIDGTKTYAFPETDVTITEVAAMPYYKVVVTGKAAEGVKVETYIRAVEPTEPEGGNGE